MREILATLCCFFLLSSLVYAGVVRDDFEDGNDDGWKVIDGEWLVEEGLYIQLGVVNFVNASYTLLQSPWDFSDGTIEVTIIYDKKSDGTEIPAILYRMTDEKNGFAFRLREDRLEIGKFQEGVYMNIRGDAFPIDINKPVKIKIEVEGIFTKVSYNGVLKIRVGDPKPAKGSEKGKIGLAVFSPGEPVYFDDFFVSGDKVTSFAALNQPVEPAGKLAATWGQMKKN